MMMTSASSSLLLSLLLPPPKKNGVAAKAGRKEAEGACCQPRHAGKVPATLLHPPPQEPGADLVGPWGVSAPQLPSSLPTDSSLSKGGKVVQGGQLGSMIFQPDDSAITHPLATAQPHHLHQPLTCLSAPQPLLALKENPGNSPDTIE